MTLQEQADLIMNQKMAEEMPRNLQGQFRYKIKSALEDGLLLAAKYGIVLVLAFLALQFATQIISGSTNGTQAALYLNELQNKGWLPKVVNGVIPQKPEAEHDTTAK